MVTLPREVGWMNKRVEPVTQRLDALTVLGASIEGAHGALLLGKSERSGIAHAFDHFRNLDRIHNHAEHGEFPACCSVRLCYNVGHFLQLARSGSGLGRRAP